MIADRDDLRIVNKTMVIKPDKCVGPIETFLVRYTTEV